MGNKLAYTGCLILTLLSGPASAQGDASAGAQKVQTCSVCHGPNGNSVNPAWPKLAGQHADYIARQLLDFKSGARANPQMTPMAAPLSEQDIQDIAAYYAAQDVSGTPLAAGVELKQVELGEKIYRAGDPGAKLPACMACHGPGATGNPAAMYPLLKGQHAAYTAAQLQAFKTETRNNDANSVMRDIAGKMSNEEIDAVSNYIQGLY
jgi:cytochrome c553